MPPGKDNEANPHPNTKAEKHPDTNPKQIVMVSPWSGLGFSSSFIKGNILSCGCSSLRSWRKVRLSLFVVVHVAPAFCKWIQLNTGGYMLLLVYISFCWFVNLI